MNRIQRIALVLLACAPLGALAQGVAFISNLKGDVAVDGNARPPLLSELAKGQKITVGRDAQMSVMYVASGKEYVLKGPSSFLVKENEVEASTGMPPVVRSTEWRTSNKVLAQVAQTSAASVRMRSIAPAKPVAAQPLLFPTQGGVATLQPVLRWTSPDRAQVTVIAIGEEKPALQAPATGGQYKVAARLRPDTEYAWTVTASGREIGTARFRTLGAEALQRIEARRPAERSEFSDRLLFALMLHEMGASQEAHAAWAQLAQERQDLPELSALAK